MTTTHDHPEPESPSPVSGAACVPATLETVLPELLPQLLAVAAECGLSGRDFGDGRLLIEPKVLPASGGNQVEATLTITTMAEVPAEAQVALLFPEDACATAYRLLTSPKVALGAPVTLQRTATPDGLWTYRLTLTLPVPTAGSSAKLLVPFRRWASQLAQLFAAYSAAAAKWTSVRGISRLEDALWDLLTDGAPRYTVASREFYRKTIGGVTFRACISPDGPYLLTVSGEVPLGAAQVVDRTGGAQHPEYHLALQGNPDQCRIPLPGFGAPELASLAKEFGISVVGPKLRRSLSRARSASFFRTPAFRSGLQHWVQENPAYARALDKHRATYLPGWYKAALPVRRLRY